MPDTLEMAARIAEVTAQRLASERDAAETVCQWQTAQHLDSMAHGAQAAADAIRLITREAGHA